MRYCVSLCLIMLCIVVFSPVVLADVADDNYIVVTCGGDVTIGLKNEEDGPGTMAKTIEEKNNEYSFVFNNMYDIFSSDDLTIVNLETTFTDYTSHKVKTYYFRAPYDYVEILKQGSIEAVTFANNHINDYLEQGKADTIRTLYENDIIFVGEEFAGVCYIDGVSIGLLGYTDFQTSFDYEKALQRDIPYMKKMYDIVIVNFHWGNEKKYDANGNQKKVGRLAIDLGADLVVGHHPHVMNGIEYYKDKFIVYSMGNLAFAGNHRPFDFDIFVFQQRFKIEDDGSVIPYGGKVIPAKVSSNERVNDYTPTPAVGEEKTRILNKLLDISEKLSYGLLEISDDWMINPKARVKE